MSENSGVLPFPSRAILSLPPDRIAAELVRRRRAIGASQVAVAAMMKPPTSAQYLGAHEQGRHAAPKFLHRWIAAVAEIEQIVERVGLELAEAGRAGVRPVAFSDLRAVAEGRE